jgi:hypothetical protein
MTDLINITISTDIKGKGGIASVLNVYRDTGFIKQRNVLLVPTHSGKKRFGELSGLFI